MTSREVVQRTIRFAGADRMPFHLPAEYGSDFAFVQMTPSVDRRVPGRGADEWGCIWDTVGASRFGQVVGFPLADWAQFDRFRIPDVRDPARWTVVEGSRARAGERFLMGVGCSLYERAGYLRGPENIWLDIYQSPHELGRLLDVFVDMNLYAIERYKEAGADGYHFCDDWGLQERLQIAPDSWRSLWKPRYARIYAAAHAAGMITSLHSCGYIVDILDDLVEIGLDVIQMDQQEHIGLDTLGKRFGGRITFMCPVDIQSVMPTGTEAEVRRYCRRLVATLGRPQGGFIATHYGDWRGIGHRHEVVAAMCDEFLTISRSGRNGMPHRVSEKVHA